MTLFKATMSQKDELCALYRTVCEGMNDAGITNWRWGEYPAEDMVEDDLRAGTDSVLREALRRLREA